MTKIDDYHDHCEPREPRRSTLVVASKPPEADATNPEHYKRLEPEPIAVIEAWGLGFCLGNAIKYIARAGFKPGTAAVEDLRKAIWYVERALRQAEAK